MDSSKKITVEEAARILGCSGTWIRQLIRDGKLRSQKFGSVHALDKAEITALRRKREKGLVRTRKVNAPQEAGQ